VHTNRPGRLLGLTEIEPVNEQKKQIETLVKKAAEAVDANDAMKFSQAATNAANAMCALQTALQWVKERDIAEPVRLD
jgi:hypothetical protein